MASCWASFGEPPSAVTATMLLVATGATETFSSSFSALRESCSLALTRFATVVEVTSLDAVSTSRVGSLDEVIRPSPESVGSLFPIGVIRRSASAL